MTAARRLAVLSLLLAAVLGGCGAEERSPAASGGGASVPELLEIAHPSLEGTDAAVRQQIHERREAVDGAASPDAQAYGDLGLVYVLYDFVEAAEACFENARRLAPEDHRWHYLVGYAQKLGGDLERAVRSFERSLELEPDFLPAMLRLGRATFDLGDHEAATRWFERSMSLEPSAAALEGLGKIAAARDDPQAAVDYLTRALAVQPGADSLRYALGQAYRRLGRMEDARRELAASGDVPVSIPDPIVSPLAVAGESAQFFLIQAAEALDDGNYEVAAGAFGRALDKDPSNFSAYKSRSFALQQLGDLEGAIATLREGLERGASGDPEQDAAEKAELHRVLGGLEALGGRDEQAIVHFREALRWRPQQSDARMKLANALARVRRFDEAVEEYTTLLAANPELEADILVRRATALVNLGRGAEAVADFERAVEARPDDPRLRVRFADVLEQLGQSERADRQRRLAAGGEGDSALRVATLLDRATAALGRNRPQEALSHLVAALELEPDNAAVRFRKASVLGHLERCEEAVADFRLVIASEPRHAGARQGEIVCLVLSGRYGPARVRLNEALRIFSRDAQLAHLQARLLATCPDPAVRDGDLALAVASRLADNVDGPRIRETLALARAASGDRAGAVELLSSLITEAGSRGDTASADDLRSKLDEIESSGVWTARSPREILDAALR